VLGLKQEVPVTLEAVESVLLEKENIFLKNSLVCHGYESRNVA